MHMKVLFAFILLLGTIYAQAQKISKIEELYKSRQFQEVINKTQEQIAAGKNNYELYYYKGLAEQALYRFNEAANSLDKAAQLTSQNKEILYLLGNAWELAGNYDLAMDAYLILLASDSLNIPAKVKMAQLYKSQKAYIKAADYLTQLIKQDSTNGYFYSELAYCCDKISLIQPAMSFYQKAITYNPNDLKSGQEFIQLLVDNKYYEDAFTLIDTLLLRFPENIRLLKQQAYVNALGGNYLDAVRKFQHVVELGDSSLFTCKYYGQSLYNNGQYPEAAYWLNRYLKSQPGDSRNQFILGMAYQKDYKYPESQQHLNLALEQLYDKDLFARIYSEKATTSQMHGDFVGFRDSTTTNAQNYYQQAVDNYLKALDLTPEDYNIYRALGLLYENKIHDLKLALYYYEKYYKDLDPKRIKEGELDWIQNRITRLKEEMHFAGYE